MTSEFRRKAMKNAVLSLALPLLLALSPSAASAARILWVSVEPGAMVVDEGEGTSTAVSQFTVSGKVLNAAKVSVDDGSPSGVTYLLFAYRDDATGSMVVDDPRSETMPLVDDSGETPVFTGASYASVYLSDILDGLDDSAEVTLELGYVDWETYEAQYVENNPATWQMSFTPMAMASAQLGQLAPFIVEVSSTDVPKESSWSPSSYQYTPPVPEPATCWTALLGVFLLSKRRKSRTAAA